MSFSSAFLFDLAFPVCYNQEKMCKAGICMFITTKTPKIMTPSADLVELRPTADGLQVTLLPSNEPISYVRLQWDFDCSLYNKILSDRWGVADGDLGWAAVEPAHAAYWYFTLAKNDEAYSFGVKTGPNCFCHWLIESDTITLTCDVRNGNGGVHLLEPLACCTVISAPCEGNESPQEHTKRFCRMMCDKPNLANFPIYGFNTWYYTYGAITHQSVLKDAELCSLLASGRIDGAPAPYMVIDDGYSRTRTAKFNGGPYIPTDDFGDMKVVADEIYERGCTPGIWIRPLSVNPELCPQLTEDCFSQNQQFSKDGFSKILDPTTNGAKDYIYNLVNGMARSGYQLIKHDFTCCDFMGDDFLKLNLTNGDWHLTDKTKTNAQILKELYLLIQEAADGGLVIGCNTYNHLVAGIHQITRSGCDTSGEHWWLTKRNGINALIYRLAQNGTFFATDADCAAFTSKVPTDKNLLFADLIARCNSALFVSAAPDILSPKEIDRLIDIFRISSMQPKEPVFLDWMDKQTPETFLIDGKEVFYDWGNPSCPF